MRCMSISASLCAPQSPRHDPSIVASSGEKTHNQLESYVTYGARLRNGSLNNTRLKIPHNRTISGFTTHPSTIVRSMVPKSTLLLFLTLRTTIASNNSFTCMTTLCKGLKSQTAFFSPRIHKKTHNTNMKMDVYKCSTSS